jgi:arylsulfatase A-like enzyme
MLSDVIHFMKTTLPNHQANAVLAALGLGLLLASGCGPGGPITARLHPDVQRPQPGVVLFLADGVGQAEIERGCREGRLPNIQRRFLANGSHVTRATTCIPAITYAAIATLLTGTEPGTHTIVGNRWFDPDQAFFRNYTTIEDYRDINDDCAAPTIYELMRPAPSASIQAAHERGVTEDVPNWAVSGVMWFFHDYTAVDKLTATSLWRVVAWANRHHQWPTLLTCYFPGTDSIGHRFGPGSPQYHRAAEHLDHQIGRVCDWLEAQGLLSTTYLALVADHGMIDVNEVIDLGRLVREKWGRNATDCTLQEGPESWRRAYFDRFDTVVAHHNGRGAFLYFAGPAGWDARPTPATVETILTAPPPEAQLWNIPGVDLVTYLGADDVALLRSARGAACIVERQTETAPEYAYQPDPEDVLGYRDDPELAAFIDAGYHSSRDWLDATAGQLYPDVVPHLIPLLHVHRAGQVVLFTQPGYSFVRERGGHGGIRREEMLIPFMLAGPGIPPGRVLETARSADLVPTLLDLVQIDPPEDAWLEGISLRQELGIPRPQSAGP